MPIFSKPVQPSPAVEVTTTNWKRTLNPKLTSKDNVHADTVKQKKLEQAKSINSASEGHVNTQPRFTTLPPKKIKATQKKKLPSHQLSIEEDADEVVDQSNNAGHQKNPTRNASLDANDGTIVIDLDDDDSEITALVVDDEEEDNVQEETEEEELHNVKIQPWNCFINL